MSHNNEEPLSYVSTYNKNNTEQFPETIKILKNLKTTTESKKY